MRIILFSILLLTLSFTVSENKELKKVNEVLTNWHSAASKAKFDDYFNLMDEESVFIGTAPGERWTKKEFMAFSKPHFDKGKAWDFKLVKRNVYFSKDNKTAWFDEVLDTWMKDCSGSGVLKKVKGKWKIAFYDLHVLMENEKMTEFLELRNKK